MNYKLTNKYFNQKNYLFFIGIAVAVIGVVILALGWWWMIALGIAVIGVALIAVSRESMVKGDEIDGEIKNVTSSFAERIIEKHNLDKAHASVISFTDYIFEGQNAASMRKGNDGKFRSKQCCSTCLFISGKTLFIDKEIFSVIEAHSESSAISFDISEISSLSIAENKIENEGGVLLRYHTLEVKGRDGSILTSAPITQNSVLYDNIDALNREIKAARKAES